jgi:hypothetical protein
MAFLSLGWPLFLLVHTVNCVQPLKAGAGACVVGSVLYVVGGTGAGTVPLSSCELIDLSSTVCAAKGWREAPSLSTPRASVALCEHDAVVYAFGGHNADGIVNTMELLYGARLRQRFTLEDAIGSHACSLEARSCVRPMVFLSGVYCL